MKIKTSKNLLMSMIEEELIKYLNEQKTNDLQDKLIQQADSIKTLPIDKILGLIKLDENNLGQAQNYDRTIMEAYVRKLAPTPPKTIQEADSILEKLSIDMQKGSTTKCEDMGSEISKLALLNSFGAIQTDFGSSSSGFILEAFLGAAFGGNQVKVGEAGIEDVAYDSGNILLSLKFLKSKKIAGNFADLTYSAKEPFAMVGKSTSLSHLKDRSGVIYAPLYTFKSLQGRNSKLFSGSIKTFERVKTNSKTTLRYKINGKQHNAKPVKQVLVYYKPPTQQTVQKKPLYYYHFDRSKDGEIVVNRTKNLTEILSEIYKIKGEKKNPMNIKTALGKYSDSTYYYLASGDPAQGTEIFKPVSDVIADGGTDKIFRYPQSDSSEENQFSFDITNDKIVDKTFNGGKGVVLRYTQDDLKKYMESSLDTIKDHLIDIEKWYIGVVAGMVQYLSNFDSLTFDFLKNNINKFDGIANNVTTCVKSSNNNQGGT